MKTHITVTEGPLAIFEERDDRTLVYAGENTAEAKRQNEIAKAMVGGAAQDVLDARDDALIQVADEGNAKIAQAQAWAEYATAPDPDTPGSRSSKSWAELSALSASIAEATVGPAYGDTQSGLAATSVGDWFAVDNADETATIWQHAADGSASNPRSMATTHLLARNSQTAPGTALLGRRGIGTLQEKLEEIQRDVEDFRQSAGQSDQSVLEAAVAAMDAAGFTLTISRAYTMVATIACSRLRLKGNGGSIIGGDFLGFSVSSGTDPALVDLSGDLTVTGFQDGADPHNQTSNYMTGFIRIATGTAVDGIFLKPGLTFHDCRSVIYAGSTTSDIVIDPTITVETCDVRGIRATGCLTVIGLRCLYSNVTMIGNQVSGSYTSGRIAAPFQAFVDGQDKADADSYYGSGTIVFAFNTIRDVANGHASYSANGAIFSARNIILHGNIVENVSGAMNTEGLYIKGRYFQITNNVLINAGSTEAAIAVKGVSQEEYDATQSGANVSPRSLRGMVCDNVIVHTNFTLDRDLLFGSGGTLTMNRGGILLATGEGIRASGNVIYGANGSGIELRGGPNARNMATRITDNLIYNHSGSAGINISGVPFAPTISRNQIFFASGLPVGTIAAIRLQDNASQGVSRSFADLRDNRVFLDDPTFASTFRGLYFDVDDYSGDLVDISNWHFSVKASTSATIEAVALIAGSAESSDTLDRLIMHDWVFSPKQTSFSSFRPVRFNSANAGKVRNIDVRLAWEAETTGASSITVQEFELSSDNYMTLDFATTAVRTDSLGYGARIRSEGVFFDDSNGAVALTNLEASRSQGGSSADSVSSNLTTSGSRVRCNVQGNSGEVWRWWIELKAKSLDGAAN